MFQIVLLIYEYMIAVETSFVQDKRFFNKSKYILKDLPIADRLDRNYFGFDQDYYERMPLLINALQEVSHKDPETRIRTPRRKQFSKSYTFKPQTTTIRNRFIKRTSPRPFIFEYRSPYPMPFTKGDGRSKTWVEQYRNAQRLKNLQDVVKYLEKTLNAKFGDVYVPTRAHIAFSGVYVAPIENKETGANVKDSHNSQKVEENSNHYSDPLYIFRPDSPGEVNLLADGFKFAPTFPSKTNEQNTELKDSEVSKQRCVGLECPIFNKNEFKSIELSSSELHSTILPEFHDNPTSLTNFNLFLPQNPQPLGNVFHKNELDRIYITTSRPIFQFKRKSTVPLRRLSYISQRRPKVFRERVKNNFISPSNKQENTTTRAYTTIKNDNDETVTDIKNNYFDSTTNRNLKPTIINSHTANYPKLNYSDIEDYHMGSSGIIPVEDRNLPTYPIVTPIVPLTDLFASTTETVTIPPEIIKFSPEDAKIPDHYLNLRKSDIDEVTEGDAWNYSATEVNHDEHEVNTLIVKLRNIIESSSIENVTDSVTNTEVTETIVEEIDTTTGTYVPQINGHYRHAKRKSLITLLQENSEKYRKKRIESLITIRNPTYVPMYVELKRNRNNTASDQN